MGFSLHLLLSILPYLHTVNPTSDYFTSIPGGTPVITLELPPTLFSAWDTPEKEADQHQALVLTTRDGGEMISMELGPIGGHPMHLGHQHSMSFSPSPDEMQHHHHQHHEHHHDHHDMLDQDDQDSGHQDSKRKREFILCLKTLRSCRK